MIVTAIYHGASQLNRVYHNGKILFEINPVEFHVIEGDKLIIQGAFSVVEAANGLYLDCKPSTNWEYPAKSGNVLYISQAYSATKSGNVLEVE